MGRREQGGPALRLRGRPGRAEEPRGRPRARPGARAAVRPAQGQRRGGAMTIGPRSLRWLIVLAVAAGASSIARADQPDRRPNVLIVMTDDQGLGDFSITGNPVLKTPNFDAF